MKNAIFAFCTIVAAHLKAAPLFDMDAMRDVRSLDVKVLKDWHAVRGEVVTRQKLISIRVGELVPGHEYRLPVRFIVPHAAKAKGFHLTGGHNFQNIQNDFRPRGLDADLIRGGVGLVFTVVQVLPASGQPELGRLAERKFIETLNPKHSIQYWGWPAAIMRAVTAAYAEKDYFETGKVAVSGASKNGASPSVAILHDRRITALHASVSPIWPSPLRLCDAEAWAALREENKEYAAHLREHGDRVNERRLLNHPFLGGTYGPIYNPEALEAGHKWADLQKLAKAMVGQVFVAPQWNALRFRGADVLFHPGTHDFVAFDLAWGGKHYPQVPLYLSANSGHGVRERHPAAERDQQNKAAFLLAHFFGGEKLLPPPLVKTNVNGQRLDVVVTFPKGARADQSRIFWMFNRGSDGSAAYIRELFPPKQWANMTAHHPSNTWKATIPLKPGAQRVDFFSNHRKLIRRDGGRVYPTYISSPYTRVQLVSSE